jgi:membrane dipeptidase
VINIYTGPAIGNVLQMHALEGHNAGALLKHHIPRWAAGGLKGNVVQVSDFATIAILLTEIAQSEGKLTFCRNRAEFDNRPEGSHGIFMSLEGYEAFAGDMHAIWALDAIGITAFTFTHNAQNKLCTGAGDRYEGGFTHVGKQTLQELSRVSMMVDLVHTSRASFWDAMEIYEGEVFVSHSNSNVVCEHPRNLTDEQVHAVAERGGIIGLNTYRGYVAADPWKATLSDYIDHAMHYYDLVGAKHIAIGADYWEGPMEILDATMASVDKDGSHGLSGSLYATGPEGLEEASKLGKIGVELAARGLSQDEIDLISGLNYLNMLDRARPTKESKA